MKKLLLMKTVLLLFALVVGSGSVWADTEVESTSFNATYGNVGDDTNVTFTSYKGGGTSNPAVNSSAIRLYQNSNGATGGYIVIGVPENYVITSATIRSTMATTTGYKLVDSDPEDTTPEKSTFNVSNKSLSANTDYTVGGISTRYIIFACFGTSSSSRLYLSKISITYQSSGGGSDPSISANPTSLSTFTYVEGNGPSAAQSISVSGSNLTHDIVVAVDDDYEISTSQNSGYSDEVILDKGEGTVSATNVYVRLKSGLAKGSHNGTLLISSEDATDIDIDLSGSVTGPKYAVTVATGLTGGEIEADPTSAEEGAEVTLSATPSSGYRLSAWDVYKTGDATTKVTVTNDKFTMPDYAVTVSATFEVIPTVTYTLATSIVPGRHYIIASGKTGTVRAMGYDKGNNRDAVSVSAVENQSTNTITVAEDAGVYEFLIEVDENEGYFTIFDETFDSGKGGYLYAGGSGSGKNYLKTSSAINTYDGFWSIEIASSGVATIIAQGSNTNNTMRYNSSSTLFSCYASGQNDIYLFERNGDTGNQTSTITINAACTDGKGNYYGTFSAPFAFVVPEGLTVSAVGVSEDKLVVTNYSTNEIVKANTGVMISSTTSGDHNVIISSETGSEKTGNLLKPSGTAGIDADEMSAAASGCLYYRLTMHNGTSLGFWWGAAEGASFALAANKAYLAVPNTTTAREGLWFGDDATAIETVKTQKADGQYFNLAGQRVAQPTKGLYIVNGKKVIVK